MAEYGIRQNVLRKNKKKRKRKRKDLAYVWGRWVAVLNMVITSSPFKKETFETQLKAGDGVSQAHAVGKGMPGGGCIPGTAKEAPVRDCKEQEAEELETGSRTKGAEWKPWLGVNCSCTVAGL